MMHHSEKCTFVRRITKSTAKLMTLKRHTQVPTQTVVSQKSASEQYCDYSESMCQTHGEHSGANNVASDNNSDAMEVNR